MRVLMFYRNLETWHRYRRQIVELARRCDGFTVYYHLGDEPKEENIRFVKGLWRALRERADLVYCKTGAYQQFMAFVLSVLKRRPLVIRVEGDGRRVDELRRVSPFIRLFREILCRISFWHAALVVPIAGHLVGEVKGQWARRVSEPVPLGVDLEQFKPGPMPEEFTVGYVGRNHAEKNIDFVMDLALMRTDLKWRLAFGDVPYEEMPLFYNGCSVLILPSLTEGFSNVLLEAYACGRWVICSSFAAPSEITTFALPLDLALWSELIDFPFKTRPRYLAERYTWDRYADSMMRILHEVVKP